MYSAIGLLSFLPSDDISADLVGAFDTESVCPQCHPLCFAQESQLLMVLWVATM